ncbi:hypothetical protein [Virgibacillus salexigens]|uniref:hypothetical protein n=1 Tax=Virgibacillus massiliensis TaxID=1462526 RepID=UPI00136C9196|nr:hypothetical protein [Virgibacillus massiliensis]MYL43951.1 hypothetical protein [Virgibacillus massiliensis]
MNKYIYVNQLVKEKQDEIADQVFLHLNQQEGLTIEETQPHVELALNSRLSDLEEIICIDDLLV